MAAYNQQSASQVSKIRSRCNIAGVRKAGKRLLIGTAALFAIYQITPYVTGCLFVIKKSRIDISRVSYPKVSADFTALEYLNLSTAIIHRETGRKGKCTDYSLAAYDVYRNLLENNNQEHLKKYVRLAMGDVRYRDDKPGGHAWLEIKLADARFHQYEATSAPASTSEDDIRRYDGENLDFFTVTRRDVVTLPGTKIPLPTKKILDVKNRDFLREINFYRNKTFPEICNLYKEMVSDVLGRNR